MSDERACLQYKKHTIRLLPDEDTESPREWSNVGTILYASRRYAFGDKRADSEEIERIARQRDNICLRVYLYIHSGATLSTHPFQGRAPHAEWDSGLYGIIYCPKARAVAEWGNRICTKGVREQAETHLQTEIEIYNRYLNGQVVGYTVEGPLCNDSCWGFYPDVHGNYQYAISEAKRAIDRAMNAQAKIIRNARKREVT